MASQWPSQPSQQGTKKDEGDWQSLLPQRVGQSLDPQSQTGNIATDAGSRILLDLADSMETDSLLSECRVPGAF